LEERIIRGTVLPLMEAVENVRAIANSEKLEKHV